MSRNGTGTYSKVNTFVSGNSITAAGHNQNWDDLVTEMTNSVAADGQTSMTGPLKAANGTFGAPGVTFASDLDCGLYRIGANNIGLAAGGVSIINIDATTCNITGIAEISSTTRAQITTTHASNECLRLNQVGAGASTTFAFFQSSGVTKGSISYNGTNTLYNATSDGRLKPTRMAFESGPIIDALNPVKHNWADALNTWDYGLIAQEAQKVLPQAVTEGKGEPGDETFVPLMLDYSKFVPVLLAEVKALRHRVAELERR